MIRLMARRLASSKPLIQDSSFPEGLLPVRVACSPTEPLPRSVVGSVGSACAKRDYLERLPAFTQAASSSWAGRASSLAECLAPPVRDHLIPECEIELWAGGAPQP